MKRHHWIVLSVVFLILMTTGLACQHETPLPATPGESTAIPSAGPAAATATPSPEPGSAQNAPTSRPDNGEESPLATPTSEPYPLATKRLVSPLPTPVAELDGDYTSFFPYVQSSDPTPTPSPTATPQPIKTVRWPRTMDAPGPSKLGLHVIRNNSPSIMEFVRRVKPAVIKAVDDVGWLADVKEASPETVTIGRFTPEHQDLVGDPVQAAQSLVNQQLERYLLNPGVDYWEGWNEADPNDQMWWYAAFEAERVRLLAQHGLKAAVGGFATGVPEWDEFIAFLPAIEAAKQYGGILTLHEYGAPTIDYLVGSPLPGQPGYANRGVLALRYRWWYEDILAPRGLVVPLVISEAGIDGTIMSGQRPGPDGYGWQDFGGYWVEQGRQGGFDGFIDQLSWYDDQLRQDDYVIGFTVFTAGAVGHWENYDITKHLPTLAFYVAEK